MTAPAQLELYCSLVWFARRDPCRGLRSLEFRMRDDLRATLWARPRGAARILVVKKMVPRKMESFMEGSWKFSTTLLLFQKN